MSLDVSTLDKARRTEVRVNGEVVEHVWYGAANGVPIVMVTSDLDAEFWVSPILNMREQGVSLVDSSGQMVINQRRLR